ncbi:hypothetical protein AOQ84DRAFT_394724 [Glonium stellatum]|uniref:Protein kinase domain-containing protein n=1 Tax=Glonium stellatum TaxID=574774 RepID=A0A8E2FCC8_9PEZI|nr:hypothetical protein AOQ84DRAFT_394724 [Glonium stellatum]
MPKYLIRPTFYSADLLLSFYLIKIINFNKDKFNYRVDLWSIGCILFKLIVGQPPFDSFMITPIILIRQMLEMANSASPGEKSGNTLQEWLEEIYFDGERNKDLTREDILKVGELVRRMLRFEPSMRASARDILQDPWFKGE